MSSVLSPILETSVCGGGRGSQNSPVGNYPEILDLVTQGDPCYFLMLTEGLNINLTFPCF